MKGNLGLRLLLIPFIFICTVCNAQNAGNEEAAIRQQAKTYVEAFNQHDAGTLVDYWAEDAIYRNPVTGVFLRGRDAIKEEFTALFDEKKDIQIELKIDSISFPEKNKAIEKGNAKITRPGEPSKETSYKVTYAKINGDWLIKTISEFDLEKAPTHYKELKELAWLIGDWIDEDEDVKIETVSSWDKYKNFITQRFIITVQDHVELEGQQVIAWDADKEKIRSWVFDSDGGFGEGFWSKKGNSWVVETAQTLANGSQASSINIYTKVDDNSFTWESTGREVDGEMLPNIDPVTVTRKKG